MKKITIRNKILVVILSVVVVVTIFLQVIKPSTQFEHVDNYFYTTISYVRNTLISNPIKSIQKAVADFSSNSQLRLENDMYRQYLEQMNQMSTQLEETYRDNQNLKDLLALHETMVEYDLVNSKIINRDHQTFNQYLILDKGSSDGVESQMAVISTLGLVGNVERVENNHSIVKLITNQESINKYSVLIQIDSKTVVNAILEGYNGDTGMFEVRLLDTSIAVSEGMKVMTSGLGEIVPSGLLIGTIDNIEERHTTLSVTVHVEPSADFADLNYLSIVTRGPKNEN